MSGRDDSLRALVLGQLEQFIGDRTAELGELAEELGPFLGEVADLVLGGKLLRPVFCSWGWRAAGGDPDDPALVTAGVAVELMHASALLHDDVLDASDQRRGRPTAHRRFAAHHAAADWRGNPAAFGAAAAILLGDLLLGWSAEVMRGCAAPPDRVTRAAAVLDRTRDEVIAGQYLDMAAQAAAAADVTASLRVVELKSARYTVERPLQLGAALAGGSAELAASLSAYGRPVGTAFQLRDDLLGVFGDADMTGKPVGDDIREGKRTVLVALGLELADPDGREALDRLVGAADLDERGIREVQRVLRSCGADREVEAMIAREAQTGLAALDAMPVADPAVRRGLADLVGAVTERAG